jgi:2-polyprenyl-6-methoxyphenol hydroxylase-like FAD-dependent oxidoreductase
MDWEVPTILRAMDQADEVYFDRVSQIQLPRWSSGRVSLIGDAAACPSLLAGEGAGLAMLEAYVLAGELHRAGGDHASAFAAYENRLHSLVSTKQRLARRFRSFFAPASALALKGRDVSVRLLASRFLGRRLFARALRDELLLPEYAA